MKKNQQLSGHLAALFTILIWAVTFVTVKMLLKVFSPTEIILYRLILAYLALFIASPRFMKPVSLREEVLFAAAGLCGVTLYLIFQNTALSYTLASNVSVLVSVSPFFTGLLSMLIFKDKPLALTFYLGFTLAIIGISLISFNGNFNLHLNPLGDLLSIASALVWSFYTLILRKIGKFGYSTLLLTRKVFFYGLIFLLPILLLGNFQTNPSALLSLPNFLNIALLGFLASALCFVTWNFAVSKLGAVRTSVYIYLIPVVTIIFSLLVLNEKLTPVAAIGSALILAGLYLSERDNRKTDPGVQEPG